MKKLVLIFIACLSVHAMAQQTDDPVIFEINGCNIYQSEFMKEFLQSVGKSPDAAPSACTYEKRKALEDYVQLYVNYRVKLADAYAKGLDTTQSLKRELKGYRAELAAPYLIDSISMNRLLREAYERNQYVLHAAHVLVRYNERQFGADSTKAYQRALELMTRAQNGEDIYKLAQEEAQREKETNLGKTTDSKQQNVNPYEGDLGCFTVFDMVYPFENKVYSLQPGEIGLVRTKYGYHIIKLFGRYEYYGRPQIAHIWVAAGSNAEERINEAYKALMVDGKDFAATAAKYSSDRRSIQNGGMMPVLPCGQVHPDYIKTIAGGMHAGDISKPFQTRFGWHIIKLVKEDTIPSYESMEGYYRNRMTRSDRSNISRTKFVNQCKNKYHFVDYTQTSIGNVKTPLKTKVKGKKNSNKASTAMPPADLTAVKVLLNDSVFMGKFHYDTSALTDTRALFVIDGHEYTSRDFADYLVFSRKKGNKMDYDKYLQQRYDEFIETSLVGYADANLETDYPEFAAIVEEYRHGLMIFAYNDLMVWKQAIIDTLGFNAYYDSVSSTYDYNDTNASIYFWDERASVRVITFTDSLCITPTKAIKIINKDIAAGKAFDMVLADLQARVNKKKCTSENPVTAELQLPEIGKQTLLHADEWHAGLYVRPMEKGYQLLLVEKILPPQLKSITEARGFYINDYQNELEHRNNQNLRKQYNVIIHQDVIDSIAY